MAHLIPRTIIARKKTSGARMARRFLRRCVCLAACLLSIAAASGLCRAEEAAPAPIQQPMSVVTILNDDNQGEPLRFPSAVAFDSEQEEIYVINGGKNGFVIYDSDFIPHLFLGAGRGIDAPQSIFFDTRDGNVFVCQGKSAKHPPRLTILNGAFFPVKEILFDNIPEAENFSPFRGALGKTGNIYLVDNNVRGVLVLDKEGNFLRWLKPKDKILRKIVRDLSEKNPLAEKDAAETPTSPESSPPQEEAELLGDLPPELRPKARAKRGDAADGPMLEPIAINDIMTDSDGHLFFLSEETSKVYVYAVNEEFLFSFGEKGGSTGKMSRPRGIAINEGRKTIYIVDYMRHTILAFDLAGKYLYEFGGRGSGPLWFNFPNSITVDRKGRLIVADLFNNRVQILKTEYDMTFTGSKGLKTGPPPTPAPGTSEQQTTPPPAGTTDAPPIKTLTQEVIPVPANNSEVDTGTTRDQQQVEPR
ncbi:MAG: hypothetical protein KKH22_00865 [Proteobacteria bacterium]|nr:hypothetical protein [Pseudomonadota bacterium]